VDIEDSKEYDSYFTLVKTLFTTPNLWPLNVLLNIASELINNLINRSYTYLLIRENSTIESSELLIEDTWTFIVGGMFRYNNNCFYGIVIDTRAIKYLTIRFN
jgi:hypothetical protein